MLHNLCPVGLKRLVGGGIERVLDMLAETGVLLEVGVCEQGGPFAVGEVGLQPAQTVRRLQRLALSRIEQEQVIPDDIQLREVRIVLGESDEILFTEAQVVEFVLEDDTSMEESIL